MLQKIIFFIFIFLPFIAFAQNNNLDINIDVKPEMVAGENLEFDYSITSDIDQDIQYVPKIECSNAPGAMLGVVDVSLESSVVYRDKYFSMKINDDIEPQECIAVIDIIEPFQRSEEIRFNIATDPIMDVKYLICQDQACQKKSKVYKDGEDIYFNYVSEVKDIFASAKIMEDGKLIEELDLPASTKLDQPGSYAVTISSQAEGYKDNIQSFPITVLEGEIKVNNKSVCQVNGECSGQETEQNCPQDCLIAEDKNTSGNKNVSSNRKNIFFVSIAAVVLVLLIILIIFIIKSRKPSTKDDNQNLQD